MADPRFDESNFDADVLKYTDGPVLVDFFAVWCGPCKMQGPIVEELAEELKDTKIRVGALDVDKAQSIAQKYGVMSIPTLIIFKDGEAIDTMVGLQQKAVLKSKLEAAS